MEGLGIPAQKGHLDWHERGDKISIDEVPLDVIDAFQSFLAQPEQLGENVFKFIDSGAAKFEWRKQELGENVTDYIMHFQITKKNPTVFIASVELRDGVLGTPHARGFIPLEEQSQDQA